ncbi:hypothetical protein ACWJJ5_04460 [Bacillus sp. JK74]
MKQLEKRKSDHIFPEYIGINKTRAEFSKINQSFEGDILVVTKLDRFPRNTQGALLVINNVFDQNINAQVLNMEISENPLEGAG